jgi:hypothetical protein
MKSNTIRLRWLALVLSAAFPMLASAVPSATSAYITDAQSSFVQDQTSDGINQVNSIMCYLGAMAPSSMVNKGDYIALIDDTKCDTGNRDKASNSGSGSSGSTASQYSTATVNSSRTSNSDPMIGKVWVDENEDGQQMTIFVHASATTAPTSTNPYGTFRMDFCGKLASGGSCMFNGLIDASSTGLSYYETGTMGGGSRVIALTLNANGTTSGTGAMSVNESMPGFGSSSTSFTFAYNTDYFRRDDGSSDQCFSRDAADASTGFSVWRYGMYDADTGARITRNSGFPIEYTTGGTTYHGYMGYWGLWLPQDVLSTIASGATVQKVSYGSGSATATDYTLVKAGGKLTKYTKGTKTLAEIDQIRFTFFANSNTAPSGWAATPAYAQGTQYEMYWDNTNTRFVITGYQSCGSNGCQVASLSAPEPTSNSYWTTNYSYGIFGWSQSLGGEVFINTAATPAASTVVTYRTQDLVYPSQYAAIGDLYCIVDCPTASGIAALLASTASTPFGSTSGSYAPTSSLVTYTLNASTGNLIDGASAAVTTASTALTGQFQWGIRSGKLFPTSNAATVDAADGSTDSTYNSWSVDSLTVYYVWETGPNAWNQFSAVKDSGGSYVTFDAPLNVNYTVPTGAAYGNYAGKTIVLQYNGFGDLFGIPGKCVSPVTNAAVDCATATNARYVPEFAIPFSQTTGTATSGSTTYLVKWLDREIRFAKKTVADCTAAGLSLPSGVTLPTSASLKDPSSASSDVYIGAKPTVTDAPRVIQGVVQY